MVSLLSTVTGKGRDKPSEPYLLSFCSHFAIVGMRPELRRTETERFAMSPARRFETERFAKLRSRSHYQ